MNHRMYDDVCRFLVAACVLGFVGVGGAYGQARAESVDRKEEGSSAAQSAGPELRQLKKQLIDIGRGLYRRGAGQSCADIEEATRAFQQMLERGSGPGRREYEAADALERVASAYARTAKRAEAAVTASRETLSGLQTISGQTDQVIADIEKKIGELEEKAGEGDDGMLLEPLETAEAAKQTMTVNATKALLQSNKAQVAVWKAFRAAQDVIVDVFERELNKQKFLADAMQSAAPAYEGVAAAVRLVGSAKLAQAEVPDDAAVATVVSKLKELDIRNLQSGGPELLPMFGKSGRIVPQDASDRLWSDVVLLCAKLESTRDKALSSVMAQTKKKR